MDLKATESNIKYLRPAGMDDVFKPLRATESNRSMGNMTAGRSLASVRREINKTISGEIVEALNEGKSLDEVLQFSTKSNDSNQTKESLASMKNVSKKVTNNQTVPKHNRNSTSTDDESNKHAGGRDNLELVTTFITDIEKLTSVLNIATNFVDNILSDAHKAIGSKTDKSIFPLCTPKPTRVLMKDLCVKSEDAKRDQPSVFNLANDFVDNILTESERRAMNFKVLGMDRFKIYQSLDEFKVRDGLEIVAKCLSRWSFNRNWFYRTLYHGRMISEEAHSLFYTVRWSVPTPNYPVAQVTVDVNFTVQLVPLNTFPFYIEVWYRMETDRSQHCAFNSKYFEKWLKIIVKRKLQVFKMFTF